jgi:hypothetical protein
MSARSSAAPGATLGPARTLLDRTLLLLPLVLAGSSCLGACRTVDPRRLAEASKHSPRATIEAFQAYVRSDLYEQEFSCFSRDFLAANQLSLFTYSEFRDAQPWLKWFAKAEVLAERSAEVLAERSGREGQHEFDLGVAGRTLRVRLVREDFWRISRGDELMNGNAPFERLVRIDPLPEGGAEVRIDLPALERPDFDPAEATSVAVERLWKIDAVVEIDV